MDLRATEEQFFEHLESPGFFILFALISSLSIYIVGVFSFYLNLVLCLSFERSNYKILNGNMTGFLVLWYYVWYVWCISGLVCLLFQNSGSATGLLVSLVMDLYMCLVSLIQIHIQWCFTVMQVFGWRSGAISLSLHQLWVLVSLFLHNKGKRMEEMYYWMNDWCLAMNIGFIYMVWYGFPLGLRVLFCHFQNIFFTQMVQTNISMAIYFFLIWSFTQWLWLYTCWKRGQHLQFLLGVIRFKWSLWYWFSVSPCCWRAWRSALTGDWESVMVTKLLVPFYWLLCMR